MPLARYFTYVGGTLLLLLFIADFCLTRQSPGATPNEEAYLIRIHSDQKWPDRIVYDTTTPTVAPAPRMDMGANEPAPAVVQKAQDSPASAPRDAFAQLQSSNTDVRPSGVAKKPKASPRHVAKRHVPSPTRLAWRQPQFGWFDQRIW